MALVIYGFIFGCLIPYVARRVGKAMPATAGYIILQIFMPGKHLARNKLQNNPHYAELFKRYVMRSIGWGIFTAALTYMFGTMFASHFIYYHLAFLWIMLLLIEIDKRFMLLPDTFTITLLILGFAYAAFRGPWIVDATPEFLSYAQQSALGAIFGYALPIIASMALVWKYPDAFGGGDIKLLAAIGAWTGPEMISYVILGSCIFFAVSCLIHHRRVGPFGPAIIYATLLLIVLLLSQN